MCNCNAKSPHGPCHATDCVKHQPKLIRMDRKYKTRGGKDVRILCVDADHPTHPVVGLIAGRSKQWPASGISINQSQSYDLIEVKEKVKIHLVCWCRRDSLSDIGVTSVSNEADARAHISRMSEGVPTFHYWYECIEKEVE